MEKELGLYVPDIWEMGSSSRVPAVSPSVGLHGSSSLALGDCRGSSFMSGSGTNSTITPTPSQ
jgi:hypothetical protein